MNRNSSSESHSEYEKQIEILRAAALKIAEAPRIGFLDLDRIKTILENSAVLLEKRILDLELGRRLVAETRESLKAKIKAIGTVCPEMLDSGFVAAVDSDPQDYDQLKSLREKTDRLFERIFGGMTLMDFKGSNIRISEFK